MARVLLIDDTPEIAELLTFALRDLGYEVSACGFTPSVNELLEAEPADALVLDCTSYDMSDAVFESVRSSPDHAQLPVVIISDTPEAAAAKLHARQAQRVLLVPKPFTGRQVAAALAQLLA